MKLFSFKKKKEPSLKAEEAKKKKGKGFFGFGGEKEGAKQEEKEAERKKKEEKAAASAVTFTARATLIRPRITEKASDLSADANAYTFEVDPKANKKEIAQAVKEMYKVDPIKVRTVRVPGKRVFNRGKMGMTKGGKKAYIYLKEGDSIEFV